MVVSGVRNSWETTEIKSVFIWLSSLSCLSDRDNKDADNTLDLFNTRFKQRMEYLFYICACGCTCLIEFNDIAIHLFKLFNFFHWNSQCTHIYQSQNNQPNRHVYRPWLRKYFPQYPSNLYLVLIVKDCSILN